MVHSAILKEKQKNENMTLVDAANVLKFLVEKNTLRDELKFQLTNISGNNLIRKSRPKKICRKYKTKVLTVPATTTKTIY